MVAALEKQFRLIYWPMTWFQLIYTNSHEAPATCQSLHPARCPPHPARHLPTTVPLPVPAFLSSIGSVLEIALGSVFERLLGSVQSSRVGVCLQVQLAVYFREYWEHAWEHTVEQAGVYRQMQSGVSCRACLDVSCRTYLELYLGAYRECTWERLEELLWSI